jgi:hypothetical protein
LIFSAVLVPAVALAGCQSDPQTAAYVGDSTVSTSQLQHTVSQGWTNAAIKATWSQDGYRRQVLQNKIAHLLLRRAATQDKVSVSNSAGVEVATQTKTHLQGGVDELNSELVQQGIAPNQQAGFFQDVALGGTVALQRGLVQTVRYGSIEVSDQATARKIFSQIQADDSTFGSIAAKNPSPNTTATPTVVSLGSLAQLSGLNPNTIRSNTSFIVPTQNGTFVVVHVFQLGQPLTAMSAFDRVALLQQGYSALEQKLLKSPGVRIRINPRFGTWNAKQAKVDGAVAPAALPTATKSATKSPQTSQ